MGYCVDMNINVKFHVSKARDIAKAFDKLEFEDKDGSRLSKGKTFQWVHEGFSKGKTVIEMFECWGYEVEMSEDYFIVNYFNHEKLGDDEILWGAMAHLVEKRSEITCTGEDQSFWKWVFVNGKMREKIGRIVYSYK